MGSRGYISPEELSIAILYAQVMPVLCQQFLTMSTQLEASMASAERFKRAVDETPQEGWTLGHGVYRLGEVVSSSSSKKEGERLLRKWGRDRDSIVRKAGGLVLRDLVCCCCCFSLASEEGEVVDATPLKGQVKGQGQEPLSPPVIVPPAHWPNKGIIEVTGLQMRYRDGPLVLKELTFSTRQHEAIGIVGRTGSGKSSLVCALFGIERHAGGTIAIDGIDISRVPLGLLRSRIGIILQTSVMFSNSLRFNLDPLGQHSDEELWTVLRAVGLGPMMESLSAMVREEEKTKGKKGLSLVSAPAADLDEADREKRHVPLDVPLQRSGLDYRVEEGGSNFSEGQRQLITFCRALLKQSTVLVLDEATASLDNLSDFRVQELLREKMGRSTTLTIAHRLHSVVGSHRVLVMQDGRVGEYGAPRALLGSLADTAGDVFLEYGGERGGGREEEGKAEGKSRGLFRDLWAQHLNSREQGVK